MLVSLPPPGYLHLFCGDLSAPQVQQDLHLPDLGLCAGLVPRAFLCSRGSCVDHSKAGSDERDSMAGMYIKKHIQSPMIPDLYVCICSQNEEGWSLCSLSSYRGTNNSDDTIIKSKPF